jgi:glucose-6-phosphate 1-epimerase
MKANAEDLVELRSQDGAGATVHLQGAHITSWLPACGAQQLFLSKKAIFEPGVAIRGGVPVVFPQFSDMGNLPKHGFARVSRWELLKNQDGHASFRLTDSEATQKLWPHAFELQLDIEIIAQELAMWLTVTNTGNAPFTFMAALHTYLRVGDAEATRAQGLSGLEFTDDVTQGISVDNLPDIRFGSDIDRLYHFAEPRSVRVDVHEVNQEGFAETVVWNPGPVTGAKIADLDQPEGWRRFICVEAAQAARPVTLHPKQMWKGGQQLLARTKAP